MTEAAIIDLGRQAVLTAALMAAPLLVTALIAGVVVGLFQALTSVQEMTLTFVPKGAAMLLVFCLSASFMVGLCVRLFDESVIPVIAPPPQAAEAS